MVLDSCRVLIGREDRFAKTAVGWILRDISKRDAALVEGSVEQNLAHFSLESLRNALKHVPREARERYVRKLKRAGRSAAHETDHPMR